MKRGVVSSGLKIGFTLTKGRIGRGGKVSVWGMTATLAGYRTPLSSTG